MPLSQKHVSDVCLAGRGFRTCRFLATDDEDQSVYCCSKLLAAGKELDEYVEEVIRENPDVKSTGLPLGDNCEGLPTFRYLEVGYDR